MLAAWRRRAAARCALTHAPDKLVALARLYGVESLLEVGGAGSA